MTAEFIGRNPKCTLNTHTQLSHNICNQYMIIPEHDIVDRLPLVLCSSNHMRTQTILLTHILNTVW